MTPRFADAMILRPLDERPGESSMSFKATSTTTGRSARRFTAESWWRCAPSRPPGVRDFHGASGRRLGQLPVRPGSGPVRLITTVRKKGRRIGLVDVELVQGERACVHAVVTLGDPEHDATPLFSGNPVVPVMAPEPRPTSYQSRPAIRPLEINHHHRHRCPAFV